MINGNVGSNVKSNVNRHVKKILIIIGIVIVTLAALFFSYVSVYYHADAEALEALKGNENVSVNRDADDRIIFEPADYNSGNLNTGFIFYPGGKVEYTAYAPLMEKLAERGITCILLKVPFNLAIIDVDAADGVIQNFEEKENRQIEHWYIGGHSLGGVAAAMYIADGHAGEYDGLILPGAYTESDLSNTDIKVLSVIGENDGLVTGEKYEKSVSNLPKGSEKYIIHGGCHAYFGSYGKQKGDGEATITPDEQKEIAADFIEKWMIRCNKNDR